MTQNSALYVYMASYIYIFCLSLGGKTGSLALLSCYPEARERQDYKTENIPGSWVTFFIKEIEGGKVGQRPKEKSSRNVCNAFP